MLDRGTYFLSSSPQGSTEWHKLRSQNFTLTASRFGAAAGLDPFMSPYKLAYSMVTGRKPKVDAVAQARMDAGTQSEPKIRRLYERLFGVKVVEVGLAISKIYPGLAASLDGMIGETGAIEIKYVKELKPAMRAAAKNSVWNKDDHSHIYDPYYAQIQGGLAIVGREWCDYVVYCHTTQELYTEKIFFNPEYWHDFLLPSLEQFRNEVVEIVKNDIPKFKLMYASDMI